MTSFPLLSFITFTPLIGVLALLLFVPNEKVCAWSPNASRWIGLIASLLTFVLSLGILCLYHPEDPGFQLVEKKVWMASSNIVYHKGVDGISLWFVLLATFLTPLCVLAAWNSIKTRVRDFMMALLLLDTMMVGMFTALDIVLFYVFFEGVLIPMFLMIGIWGGDKRIYAAYKFFLYTFLGSVLMLVAVFVMISYMGTTDMTAMMGGKFPKEMGFWLWLAFFASFAVKTPLWPFHTWLPDAHGEAPTAGSMLLAGVLLKMGTYGFLRISIQMFPDASVTFAPMMSVLAVIAIIYGSLVALAQTDMKKLVAYSSVAHMGIVILALFSFNKEALNGALFVILSHGIVSAALFFGVGVLYDRTHTRMIKDYGGVASVMPRFATVFMIMSLAAIGLPGTSGFVGELLSLQGAFLANNLYASLAALGVILGAAYMLWLYQCVFWGRADKPNVQTLTDISVREMVVFSPMLLLVFVMGLYPTAFNMVWNSSVTKLLSDFHAVTGGHV